MDTPNFNNITSIATWYNSGTNNLFFSILMLPVFFILLFTLRASNVGDSIDCLNITSWVCLMISFTFNAVGLVHVGVVGIFLAMTIIGIIMKRFIQ